MGSKTPFDHMDFFSPCPTLSPKERLQRIGASTALEALGKMVTIRNFEIRGESAYQHGLVGGFYHAYSGQEAIQTAVTQVMGKDHWYLTTYRCHALALLLGATPNELMAELYGKKTGNAKGRGGAMHFYTEKLLGGFAIVGGHLPIACGAAFSLKYQNKNSLLSLCFLGEGAVAQGAFHESLNLASLWELPVIFIIENNGWGMGTSVTRAICTDEIAKRQGYSYNMSNYTLNGRDWIECYLGFEHIYKEALSTRKPILVECLCDRFRGHSISDPGLYRTKEELKTIIEADPILKLKSLLEKENMITEDEFKEIDKRARETMVEAMQFAEKSPFPSSVELEEEVYAP
jgi:pyruvate dehydrogenase E1 component alpha subunit